MSEFEVMLKKIVSGGQSGTDISALEAACELGLSTGGWMPPDGCNEDGRIPEVYGLVPTPIEFSSFGLDIPRSLRTEWNVRDSDGTLIIASRVEWDRGTSFTQEMCEMLDKPCFMADLDASVQSICLWLKAHNIEILNIAGPKASVMSDGTNLLKTFIVALLIACK